MDEPTIYADFDEINESFRLSANDQGDVGDWTFTLEDIDYAFRDIGNMKEKYDKFTITNSIMSPITKISKCAQPKHNVYFKYTFTKKLLTENTEFKFSNSKKYRRGKQRT